MTISMNEGRVLHMNIPWIPAMILIVAFSISHGLAPGVSMAADATYYELQDKMGRHKIVYEMANMLGKSQFTYNGHVFSGSAIRRKSVTDLGETISVTLNQGKQGDSTTLTLILPRVAVEQDNGTKIKTVAVSTFHQNHPTDDQKDQRDVYSIINLIGLALSGPPAEPEPKK